VNCNLTLTVGVRWNAKYASKKQVRGKEPNFEQTKAGQVTKAESGGGATGQSPKVGLGGSLSESCGAEGSTQN
jgi:hypothetical protein